MSIHLALCVFSPNGFSSFEEEYFRQFNRCRLNLFGRAVKESKGEVEKVTLFSLISRPELKDEMLELLKDQQFGYYSCNVEVDIIVLEGNRETKQRANHHAGAGYLQYLVENNSEWLFLFEDGHTTPIRRNPFVSFLKTFNEQVDSKVDVIVPGVGYRHYKPGLHKSTDRFVRPRLSSEIKEFEFINNHEWGLCMSYDGHRKYKRIMSYSRGCDGTLFALCGAKIGLTSLFDDYFHHTAFNYFQVSDLQREPICKSWNSSVVDNCLLLKIEQEWRESSQRLKSIEKKEFRNGQFS